MHTQTSSSIHNDAVNKLNANIQGFLDTGVYVQGDIDQKGYFFLTGTPEKGYIKRLAKAHKIKPLIISPLHMRSNYSGYTSVIPNTAHFDAIHAPLRVVAKYMATPYLAAEYRPCSVAAFRGKTVTTYYFNDSNASELVNNIIRTVATTPRIRKAMGLNPTPPDWVFNI